MTNDKSKRVEIWWRNLVVGASQAEGREKVPEPRRSMTSSKHGTGPPVTMGLKTGELRRGNEGEESGHSSEQHCHIKWSQT